MKTWLRLFVMLVFTISAAQASTYYVRTDGGTGVQNGGTIAECDGLTNAAYPDTVTATWVGRGVYAYPLNTLIVDYNNNVQKVTATGTTGNYPPSWSTSGTTTDGSVTWTYQRPALVNQHCAVRHPFWLINQDSWFWKIAQNDIVKFADVGPYYVGLTLDGVLGSYWPYCYGQSSACSMLALPNGVHLLGYNSGSCHNASHSALVNPTKLVGLNNTFDVIDLRSSVNADAECFDISQPDMCTLSGVGVIPTGLNCSAGVNNYINRGGLVLSYLTTNGPVNSTVRDLQIHGLANEAVTGGKMNILGAITAWSVSSNVVTFTAPNSLSAGATVTLQQFPTSTFFNSRTVTVLSSGLSGTQFKAAFTHADGSATEAGTFGAGTMTFSDIYMYGNAYTGWDGDAGGCHTDCESTGTVNLSYINAYWSGCMEIKPNGGTVGGNGVTTCVDQAYNGNGDNIVMIATGGTWNWDHVLAKWGTQDGIDLLHMSDDTTAGLVVNMNIVDAEGNEGQAWKVGGTVTGSNMRLITNCRRLHAPFPGNPSDYNAYLGLSCRAFNGTTAVLAQGSVVTVQNSTIVGVGTPMIDFECYTGSGSLCPANTWHVVFRNNLMYGYNDQIFNTQPGGFYWQNLPGDPCIQTGSICTNNLWATGTMKASDGGPSTGCPQNPYETSYVCPDPLLIGETTANAQLDYYNINLSSNSSPAIAAGVNTGIATDFNGNPRTSPYTIGAVNFITGGTGGGVIGVFRSTSGTVWK